MFKIGQAVNIKSKIIAGERYKIVTNETKDLARGMYGNADGIFHCSSPKAKRGKGEKKGGDRRSRGRNLKKPPHLVDLIL